jgi:anti-anti-sigma factor
MDLSQVRKVGDAVVIAFPESRAEEPRRVFHDMLKALAENNECKRIVVDLSKVSWFSSLDIGGLVFAFREAQARDGSFVVAGAGSRIRGIFEATRMDTVFPMYATVDDALSAE